MAININQIIEFLKILKIKIQDFHLKILIVLKSATAFQIKPDSQNKFT